MSNKQLRSWAGDFGRSYTDRNTADWKKRLPAFQRMVGDLRLERILEIGCNRGHNLVTLSELFESCELVGIEPNPHALEIALRTSGDAEVLNGHARELPFEDGYFDLVLTCGVLIHIPPEELSAVLDEIYRVTCRYILTIEYFAEVETPIHYRGYDDLLWKRDFLMCWKQKFPGISVVSRGYWDDEDGFDRSHWWLLNKSAP